MKRYNPKDIEPKWQKLWLDKEVYKVDFDSDKPKYFGFSMFNYPSGAGIHIGHALTYTISDVKSRFKRQQGYESYHPVGWDAFGLPAENYAIKAGVSPQESMSKIIPSYHSQYQAMGWSNDWSKEISTHLPEYYKWTQWLFVKMYEEGLAYQDAREQWFCEQCQTVLSDAQVIDGKCWRHDGADDPEIKKKQIRQWFFKITDYADELLDATHDLNWTDSVKLAQENWIGRKTGIEIEYEIEGTDEVVTCFTTRPDTNFGATFVVLAPEHEFSRKVANKELVGEEDQSEQIAAYIKKSTAKSEVERQQEGRKKTGAFTGFYAINKLNGEKMPIWVSDFVLAGFGTGAVVGVPGHDVRDFQFATQFDIPIVRVVVSADGDTSDITEEQQVQESVGTMINSQFLDGMDIHEATEKMMDHMEANDMGKRVVNYRMRDWSVARQRYWGAPIPVVNCVSCYTPDSKVAATIDYAHHEGFVWAKEGKKTVLTRAKTEELAAVSSGDIIKFVDNKTSEEVYARASSVSEFSDVDELFDKSNYPTQTFKKEFKSVDELRAEYNSNRAGYADVLDESGIVVIEFTILEKPIVLKDEHLPVVLPELDDFKPSGDGRSALGRAKDWLTVDCPDPKCGGKAQRETDTLDTYVCSSWYMMRYLSPSDDTQPVDPDVAKKWWNVDFYNGADHATAHLLYARFISRFLHKIGYLPEPEPFANFLFNGKLTASDGTMFSKSKGNGVDPLEIIDQGYGADALRTYLMFAAPLEQWIRWDPQGVPGTYRFLGRLWGIVQEFHEAKEGSVSEETADKLARAGAKLAHKVTADIEESKYNTAIAACMGTLNDLYKLKEQDFASGAEWRSALETIVMCVAPFAPHIADELWEQLGNNSSVHVDNWPEVDESLLVDEMITIVVQVNGKVRANIKIAADTPEDEIKTSAEADENVQKFIDGKDIKKSIYVPGKLVNFVV